MTDQHISPASHRLPDIMAIPPPTREHISKYFFWRALPTSFEKWIQRIDASVVKSDPSLEYAINGKHPSIDGDDEYRDDYSKNVSWTQPGGMVFVAKFGNSARVMGLPLITQPVPTALSTLEERKRYEAQQRHRFEYWINKLSPETAERVAADIICHLKGPTF